MDFYILLKMKAMNQNLNPVRQIGVEMKNIKRILSFVYHTYLVDTRTFRKFNKKIHAFVRGYYQNQRCLRNNGSWIPSLGTAKVKLKKIIILEINVQGDYYARALEYSD